MLDKRAKRSIKEQIAAEKAELQKLAEIKQYLHREFVATTAEQDAVLDVIAQVCNRCEERIKALMEKLIFD